MATITGRIIRILDTRTVIVNLGREHGISHNTTFRVHASPESIVDPYTSEELGKVVLVKARLKASQVFDKFTIASTKWTESTFSGVGSSSSSLLDWLGSQPVDTGELRVLPEEIRPWRAVSEEPVRVGDTVEVEPSAAPAAPVKKRPAPSRGSKPSARPSAQPKPRA
jgi:hypothetical protein